jgi:radical SAM superfamily enzyme YgiQ (UPF0313 family)
MIPSPPSPGTRLSILAWKPGPERQTIRMDRVITCEPLELEYLYTIFEAEEVTLLDGMTDRRDPVRLARKLRPQVVLVTSFITNVHTVLAVARRLKRLPSPPLVFVGGPHPEVVPEHFFDPAVDGVFFADQLAQVREAIQRWRAGLSFTDLPGAAFQVDGRFVRNPGPPLDPASLPLPRRVALAAAPERYRYLYLDRCASVKTAFGCHERCTFCFCTEQQGGRYAPRPIPQVVDEIAALPVENVFVLDDNFLSSRARVLEFCQRLDERGVRKRFVIYGGADFVARHPDVMERLRDVGVVGLIVGFEFATDPELIAVNKRARLEDNDRTVEICKKLGIELFALFMVNPDWRQEDFCRLRDYVRSRRIVFATFATYTVFPGTQLALEAASPPGPPWWRYDLLRLHRRPRHLSPLRYYLWLFYLYLLPGLSRATGRRLRELFGVWGFVKLVWKSWWMGVEFLVKLLIWR